jgi:hypothetical protein
MNKDGGSSINNYEDAVERMRSRKANPAFKEDPVWLGLSVPKEQPWKPFVEREPIEKIARRARRKRIH